MTTAPQIWQLDELEDEILAALARGASGDGQVIDGRALAVKASPACRNSTSIVMGTAACPPGGFQTPRHSHHAEEIAVFLSGRGTVEIEGVRYPVRAGTVLLTPSGASHVSYSEDPQEPLVVLWFYAPPGSEVRWIEPEKHATAGYFG